MPTYEIEKYAVTTEADAYTVNITNDAKTLPTTTGGVVTYDNSGTTISVIKGTTQLQAVATGTAPGPGQFRVVQGDITDTDITVDSEDYAEILIESDNTPRASIHINYASHYKERKIIADFEGFTLNCDLISNSINKYSKEELIEKKEFDIYQNYTYEKQLDYFFKYNSPTMMNNIFEASDLFKKIIDYKEN